MPLLQERIYLLKLRACELTKEETKEVHKLIMVPVAQELTKEQRKFLDALILKYDAELDTSKYDFDKMKRQRQLP